MTEIKNEDNQTIIASIAEKPNLEGLTIDINIGNILNLSKVNEEDKYTTYKKVFESMMNHLNWENILNGVAEGMGFDSYSALKESWK